MEFVELYTKGMHNVNIGIAICTAVCLLIIYKLMR